MEWGFLGEFWNSIASTTVGGVEYTTGWFKQIGLSMAGAIGNLFDYINHSFSDLFVFLGWLFEALKQLVYSLTTPIAYAGSFLRGLVVNAVKEPPTPEASYTFATSTLSIFNDIPHWGVMTTVIGVCILVLGGVAIIMLITKL